MIKSITLLKGTNFSNRLFHQKNKDIIYNFSDGINIITGRNGSGKSVLLNILKNNCFINKDNSSPVMPKPFDIHNFMINDEDNAWDNIPNLIKKNIRNINYPNSNIVWDGSMVHYLTPDTFDANNMWKNYDSPFPKSDGLFSGIEILGKIMSNKSKGEESINILNKIYNLTTKYPSPLDPKANNDIWVKTSDIFQNWLNSMPKDGKPTLLIDELDSHLDLDNQKLYWEYINNLTQKWQIIVVSHSIFALRLKKICKFEINYINLNPEYFNKVNKLVL
jgi:energy-coupling factor transporter ATP-binding protein EcfA2